MTNTFHYTAKLSVHKHCNTYVVYPLDQQRPEGSATARLSARGFEIHWKSLGFRISDWILDFNMDLWISNWISFEFLLFVTLKIQLKYTHKQSLNHIPLNLDAHRIHYAAHTACI